MKWKYKELAPDCRACADSGEKRFGIVDEGGEEIIAEGHDAIIPDKSIMQQIVKDHNALHEPGKEEFDNWVFQTVCISFSKGEVDYVGLFMEDAEPIPPAAEEYIKRLFKKDAEAKYAKEKAKYRKRKAKV